MSQQPNAARLVIGAHQQATVVATRAGDADVTVLVAYDEDGTPWVKIDGEQHARVRVLVPHRMVSPS